MNGAIVATFNPIKGGFHFLPPTRFHRIEEPIHLIGDDPSVPPRNDFGSSRLCGFARRLRRHRFGREYDTTGANLSVPQHKGSADGTEPPWTGDEVWKPSTDRNVLAANR